DEVASAAAERLAERLNVTLLLTGDVALSPPAVVTVPMVHGRAITAQGHLGAFTVEIEDYAAAKPSSRGQLAFEPPARDRGRSECDLILDLRGAAPLFASTKKRDGYFNPDPRDPLQVEKALFDLVDLVGEFERPLYVDYDAGICAHARSGIVGCSRCIDNCPAGAIVADGDAVAIDPFVCAGCGNCAALCPTGAASYTVPRLNSTLERLRTMLLTYRKAGGTHPALLFHDGDDGEAMLDALARHYDGLPARVLPFAVNAVTQVGLETLLAAVAYGAERMLLSLPPRNVDDASGLRETAALANHILEGLGYGTEPVDVIEEADPELLNSRLWHTDAALPAVAEPATFLPIGGKREVLALVLEALHKAAPAPVDRLSLPDGAPFGTVAVDVANCTLCLACVGACPAKALGDDPGHPRLTFLERACIQCGLCQRTCPEKVISLQPGLDFTAAARDLRTIKEEAPFECVRCGAPFGARSTVENMVAKLADHAMYRDEASLNRLRMCADCRVIDMSESDADPFAIGSRPVPRTTDDYLSGKLADDDDDA
ncbi:MAG: 4Fe-4S dicluster domain-containing protein, partial [Alphaproteobacteria bacterium]|nr:4Fe-4S dicluster domain-containing protein [Alphaproteobacteria bacterium]